MEMKKMKFQEDLINEMNKIMIEELKPKRKRKCRHGQRTTADGESWYCANCREKVMSFEEQKRMTGKYI